jgi:hypothetical protein
VHALARDDHRHLRLEQRVGGGIHRFRVRRDERSHCRLVVELGGGCDGRMSVEHIAHPTRQTRPTFRASVNARRNAGTIISGVVTDSALLVMCWKFSVALKFGGTFASAREGPGTMTTSGTPSE